MNELNKHFKPKNFSDKVALSFTKFLRLLADTFFKKRYGHRAVVRKIASLKDLFNAPIREITLHLLSKSQLKDINNFLDKKGDTQVNINISDGSKISVFKLKTLRNIDRKSINILRNKEISLNIH